MNSKRLFTEHPYKIILSLISCVLWGSAFPVLKISYEELKIGQNDMNSRLALAGMRFFLASLLIFIFIVLVMKTSIKVGKKDLLNLLLLGSIQTALYYFLFYNGIANTTGMKGSIIGALETFIMIILAHFLYNNDKIDSTKIIGLIAGFAGVIFANWGKSFGLEISFKGEGLLIISSFIGAATSIYIKNYSQRLHPFLITAWQMFLGSLVMLALSLPKITKGSMVFNTKSSLLLIYSALLSAVAFSIWYTLLKYNKAGEISIYRFFIPVSGALLSALFLPEENFTLPIFIALVLVALGVVFVNKRSNKKGKEVADFK
ncbi:DMT family transporter [Clostridium amazonitimonense]|uniref:DMT family transporter n=1 Tax=Clostridium amazonitimonense TaxID=1499689 RepID=UPI0005AA5C65|nr:DMT family transporter [Clostridium amazonitimonense]